MDLRTATGGIALILFLTLGSAAGRFYVTASDERSMWPHSLDDESKGLIFFASGPANRTFNVASTFENCDDALADIRSNQHFVTDLWDRGFNEVACTAVINGVVTTANQKIGPVPERKPLPKPDRRGWRNWVPQSA